MKRNFLSMWLVLLAMTLFSCESTKNSEKEIGEQPPPDFLTVDDVPEGGVDVVGSFLDDFGSGGIGVGALGDVGLEGDHVLLEVVVLGVHRVACRGTRCGS